MKSLYYDYDNCEEQRFVQNQEMCELSLLK
jgi:hypothetical protein